MRLQSLYIKNYKNLNNININFESGDGFNLIIGNNGSGKSNILEVVSGIFHDLHNKNNSFFQKEIEYELSYKINEKSIKIKKDMNRRNFYINEKKVSMNDININKYYPTRIIFMYSGEEKRLWNSIYRYFFEQHIKSIKNNNYTTKLKLMWIDNNYWDIALLSLLISKLESVKNFVEKDIQFSKDVEIIFEFNNIFLNNTLLENFIKNFNPEMELKISVTLEKLSLIFSDITESEVYQNFIQLFYKNYLKKINIIFNKEFSSKELSEGEKKLILLKSTLEFLADEKTLVLLDEPDAYLHEQRKNKMYKMLKEYAIDYKRNIIFTSHSPTIIDLASENEIIYLTKNSSSQKIEIDKLKKLEIIKKLTGSRNDIFFNDTILLVEGKSDQIIIEKVIEYLKKKDIYKDKIPNYQFYCVGGTGNMKYWYLELYKIRNNENIIILLDDDDAGKKTFKEFGKELLFKEIDDKLKIKEKDYIVLLPFNEENKFGKMIEDYFSKDFIKKLIEEKLTSERWKGRFSDLPKIKDEIKKELGEKSFNIPDEELENFKILIDKILEISN